MVLTQTQWQGLATREAIITLDEPPPLLVVEVVSESTRTTDYRAKRSEYAVLEIPEYWLVDNAEQTVKVCHLVDGFYDEVVFTLTDQITSHCFPELSLRVEQILTA